MVTGNYGNSGFMARCTGTVKNLILEGKVNTSLNHRNSNLVCGGIVGTAGLVLHRYHGRTALCDGEG